jgi:hypothetical protein
LEFLGRYKNVKLKKVKVFMINDKYFVEVINHEKVAKKKKKVNDDSD